MTSPAVFTEPLPPPTAGDLRRTHFVDFDDPRIAAFVAEHAGSDTAPPMTRASLLFRAVRDEVRYDPYIADLAPAALTASYALGKRRAFCVPKAALYAGTLRAIGIPARLGFADVTNHLTTRRLVEVLRTSVFAFHGYVLVWTGERWLKATPAFDRVLCTHFDVPPLEFDGTEDAMLQASDKNGRAFMEYLRDRGIYDDVPYDVMVDAWREVYPHFFAAEGSWIDGDLQAEREREKR